MPSYTGVPLLVWFMYRKAGSRPVDKLDRLLGDAETYQFGIEAAAQADRTREIWLALHDIPKPKTAKSETFFTLPWIDTPNIAETQLHETQSS